MDVGLYEFPEKGKIIKVKISFNISLPIRVDMFIGNEKDGINLIDFRYDNLHMFCFGCGLVGHNSENCRNPPLMFKGDTNPRRAWLRSKNYGRRLVEEKEKTFNNNSKKSLSGRHEYQQTGVHELWTKTP